MQNQETSRPLTAVPPRRKNKKSELIIWLLMPLFFAVGAGLSAVLQERYGPLGIAMVAGMVLVGALLVVVWPGE